MSILDTFYILFESNADKAKKGVEGVTKATDDADAHLSAMDRNVAAVGERIVGTFKEVAAVIAAAFTIEKAKGLIEYNAQLGVTAERLGIAVEDLGAYSNAAVRAGGSAEGFTATLDALNRGMADIATKGTSRLKPFFDELGIRVTDGKGNVKGLLPLLDELSEKFHGLSAQQRAGQAEKLGIDPGTLLLLAQGRRAMDDLVEREKRLGVTTKEQAEEAHAFAQQWDDIAVIFRHVGTVVLGYIIPPLSTAANLITGVVTFLENHLPFTETLFAGLATVLTIRYLPAVIEAALATWALVAPLLVAAAPFLLIAGAVALAAFAIDDFITYMRGGKSIIGELIDKVPGLKGGLHDVYEAFIKDGKIIENTIKGWYDWFVKLIGKIQYLPHVFAGVAAALGFGGGATATAPAAKAPVVSDASPSSAATSLNAKQSALKFFMAQGWKPEQAAGIVANLMRESSLNSNAVGDHGAAYGIAQWHDERQKAFAQLFGKDIRQSTLLDQLAFVDHELKSGYGGAASKLVGAKTAAEAAAIVSRLYERPGAADNEAAVRAALAGTLTPDLAELLTRGREQIKTADVTPFGAQTGASVAAGAGNTYHVNVGDVHIATAADDAEGVARAIGGHLQKEMRQAVAHFDDGVAS